MNLSRMSFVFIVANSNWLDVVSIFLSGMLSVFVLSGMLSVFVLSGMLSVFVLSGMLSVFVLSEMLSVFVLCGMFSVVQCQTSSCRSSVTADLGRSVSHDCMTNLCHDHKVLL